MNACYLLTVQPKGMPMAKTFFHFLSVTDDIIKHYVRKHFDNQPRGNQPN